MVLEVERLFNVRIDLNECAPICEDFQVQLRSDLCYLFMACLDVAVAAYQREHGDVEELHEGLTSSVQTVSEFWL